MFGTVSQQKLSTFVHLDPLKERLNLPIVHHFLNVFNLKSYLRVYCLYVCGLVCIVCVCVCVCVFVCMGSGKCWLQPHYPCSFTTLIIVLMLF